MLSLINISKVYKSSSGNVQALDGVNLNFRKNEFVSILGPSGSGKTTLLNIIGGLDKYTDGDLVIAGKSTKGFKDRDWDFYRNQRIGFIFQSYNLIPHQNVLSNVELALTISGISKQERIERAKAALDKVGLSDQYYKRPNQLSGGQCQRVAIARALVNNPEILLADEPTGALDTKTSTQIMDLIREISKDKLVIMVTHNPDLAKAYSSRIINLLDGKVVEDSNPFASAEEHKEIEKLPEEDIEKVSKAKMGVFTAMKLSFKNLISKKGRTILVAIASSIGIIGVSTVLAVSFGVTNFVNNMQDDMLSSYPLSIAERSVDMTSLLTGLSNSQKKEIAENFDINTQVGMESLITYLMDKYSDVTNIKTNDINQDLVDFVTYNLDDKDVASKHFDYGIDVTNNVFCNWTKSAKAEHSEKTWISANGLTQRYIEELKTVNGFTEYASYVNLFTNFMKEVPGDKEYILSQYDLLGNSTYPKDSSEMMLVVTKDTTLTDLVLGQLGYYNHDEFINIGRKAVEIYKQSDIDAQKGWKQKLQEHLITQQEYDEAMVMLAAKYPYREIFNYDELIGSEFYYVPSKTLWNYGDVSSDYTITGNVLLVSNEVIYYFQYIKYAPYDALVGYEIDLVNAGDPQMRYFVRQASESRDMNTFFNGLWAEIDGVMSRKQTGRILNLSSSTSGGVTDTATLLDTKAGKTINFTNVKTAAQETTSVTGFKYPAEAKQEWLDNPDASGAVKMKVSGILRAKSSTQFGSLSRGIYYTQDFTKKYMLDAKDTNNSIIYDIEHGFKSFYDTKKAKNQAFNAYVTYDYVSFAKDEDNPELKTGGYANALNGDLKDSLSELFSALTGAISYESTNKMHYRALTGVKVTMHEKEEDPSYYQVTFEDLPEEIELYPRDFKSKNNITKTLDTWNSDDDIIVNGRTIKRSERKDLNYTDTVALIINLINSLITIVTISLVSFTSLSLVVSCFMIAVITYISVMERVKEIGVIRSLGGRKKDVSRLFTAENFMTGLASGVLGIVVTYLLSGVINLIVRFFGVQRMAALPWWVAIIMVLLSILLNVISGFIPSKKAARQDPVEALRSE